MARVSGRKKLDADQIIKDVIGKEGMIHFSFVRHPFERLVSAFVDKGNRIVHRTGNKFTDFVDGLLQMAKDKGCFETPYKCRINLHLKPQMARCYYCSIKYHVIGKQETFSDDAAYIIFKRNLESQLSPDLQLYAFTNDTTSKGLKKPAAKIEFPTERAASYFKQLSQEQIRFLEELYKWDFKVFGYDPAPYYNL